jgi:hypothetical protein
MKRLREASLAVVLTALLAAAGCGASSPGTTRMLGKVDYATAFATARDVLGQNDFAIESANPDTGVIRTLPRLVGPGGERLFSESQTRHVATLRLRREDGQVAAEPTVAQQQQDAEVFRQMGEASDSYDTVPNRTPAEVEAPASPEQRRVWRTESYRHDIERRVLNELYLALHPAAGP